MMAVDGKELCFLLISPEDVYDDVSMYFLDITLPTKGINFVHRWPLTASSTLNQSDWPALIQSAVRLRRAAH